MGSILEESGDQQDGCEVSRTSLGTSRITMKSRGRSWGTSRIAVKSLKRVWDKQISCEVSRKKLGQVV